MMTNKIDKLETKSKYRIIQFIKNNHKIQTFKNNKKIQIIKINKKIKKIRNNLQPLMKFKI
jgi:hypothetical protein